jgi:hypothetical protein
MPTPPLRLQAPLPAAFSTSTAPGTAARNNGGGLGGRGGVPATPRPPPGSAFATSAAALAGGAGAGDALNTTAPAPAAARPLRILRDDPVRGAVVEGLTEEIVTSREQMLAVVARGEAQRHYGATALNADSSRSHTLFRVVIESRVPSSASAASVVSDDGGDDDVGAAVSSASSASPMLTRVSYLTLVDLAGSERSDAADTVRDRLREGGAINRSLSALAQVIRKLADAGRRERAAAAASAASGAPPTPSSAAMAHIPYRNSKLTRLLRHCLGGPALTAVLLTVSPLPEAVDEGLSTLTFGVACKAIPVRAAVNAVVDDKVCAADRARVCRRRRRTTHHR